METARSSSWGPPRRPATATRRSSGSRPGVALDRSFSGDGQFSLSFPSAKAYPQGVATLPNGKILVVGGVDPTVGDSDMFVLRLTHDGHLDKTFSGDGRRLIDFVGDDWGYAVATDGSSIVVGGAQGNGPTTTTFGVARLTADGPLDSSFAGDGLASVDARARRGGLCDRALRQRRRYVPPRGRRIADRHVRDRLRARDGRRAARSDVRRRRRHADLRPDGGRRLSRPGRHRAQRRQDRRRGRERGQRHEDPGASVSGRRFARHGFRRRRRGRHDEHLAVLGRLRRRGDVERQDRCRRPPRRARPTTWPSPGTCASGRSRGSSPRSGALRASGCSRGGTGRRNAAARGVACP